MAQTHRQFFPFGQRGQRVKVLPPDRVRHKVRAVGEDHLLGLRADLRDKQPVGRRDTQPPALTDGIAMDTPVPAQHPAGPVHKMARRRHRASGLQPGGVVAVRNETDFHAVRFLRHRQSKVPGQLPNLGLFIPADGKHQAGQPVLGQPGQHIGLVIGVGAPAEQRLPRRSGGNPRIVPGGHPVRPHLLRPPEQGGKLHRRVAAGAGQRGAPGQVIPLKRAHHRRLQLPADISGGKRDAEGLRHLLGVLPAAQADVQPMPVDRVALLLEQAGGHGGVHPAGEPQHHRLTAHGGPPWAPPPGRRFVR